MKIMLHILLATVFCAGNAIAAPVVWNAFYQNCSQVTDVDSGELIDGIGISGYVAEEDRAYLMADVGLGYIMKDGVVDALIPASNPQTLTGKALFVLAFAGDVLTDQYLSEAQLVLDYRQGVGLSEKYGDAAINIEDGNSVYLAFTARGFLLDEGESFTGQEDLYGWIRLDMQGDRLVIGSSAFADWQGLVVGTGQAVQNIPEPSTLLLFGLGFSLLGLRRPVYTKS